MNRQIKFRAWDKDNKEWIAPERIYIGANGELLSYGSSDDTGGFDTEIVVMFWTGLFDFNGKEIYEGDLLSDTMRPFIKWEVKWNHDCWALYSKGQPKFGYVDNAFEHIANVKDNRHDFRKRHTVIGNIYEPTHENKL